MNNTALEYLQKDEWTMGNGQCPCCYGSKPFNGWWTKTTGHTPNCKLAQSIEQLGGNVIWERINMEPSRAHFMTPPQSTIEFIQQQYLTNVYNNK